jgi:cyclophilin family peptidyl-prolyl cis-trans isomerase
MEVTGSRSARRTAQRPLVEVLEGRQLLASLEPISNLTVPSQQGYTVPLNGSGTTDDQTFTVSSSNPDIAASIGQGPFWTVNVQYTDTNTSVGGPPSFSGPLVFQLFQNLTPNTVSMITQFTNDGYYNGKHFTRVAPNFPGPTDYVVQGGAPNANGTGSSGQPGTPFANENVQQLAFTGTEQIAMANAGGTDTNDTQFFITTGSPNSELGYNYTIFGQMVSGQNTLTMMTQVPTSPNSGLMGEKSLPDNPLIMTSVSLASGNPNGVVVLSTTQARPGETGSITVTATDPTNGTTTSQSFNVTVGSFAGPTDPAINFQPLANPVTATTTPNTATTITLAGKSGYPDSTMPSTLSYSIVAQPSHGTISQLNASTGSLVYTPDSGFTGKDTFSYMVSATGPKTTPATTTSNPATVTISVGEPLVSIAVTPTNTTIAKGQTEQFTAIGTLANNTTEDVTNQVTWTSSNTAVAGISSTGLATAIAPGVTAISANFAGVTGSTFLTVPKTLVSIAVTPTNPSIGQGQTEQFTATGTYSDNSTQNLSNQVAWASSNTAVAGISSSGLATTHATGTSTISAAFDGIIGSTSLMVMPVLTGEVRVVGPVLIVTPSPRFGPGKNTINVAEVSNSAASSGFVIQVTINGLTDVNQPDAGSIDDIIVFGSKINDNITIEPSVQVPATIDGGHGGRNILKGKGVFVVEHGWFGQTTLIGGPGLTELIGRAGNVRFRPTNSTILIFAGEPHQRTSTLQPVPPGGTFYKFVKGRLIPVPESDLFPKPLSHKRGKPKPVPTKHGGVTHKK